MKVLVVTPACHFKNSGATQNDMYALLGHLRNLGHNVVLYTLDSPKQDKNTLNKVASKYGVPIETFEPNTHSIIRWILRLFEEPALFDRAAYVFDILARSLSKGRLRIGDELIEINPLNLRRFLRSLADQHLFLP